MRSCIMGTAWRVAYRSPGPDGWAGRLGMAIMAGMHSYGKSIQPIKVCVAFICIAKLESKREGNLLPVAESLMKIILIP